MIISLGPEILAMVSRHGTVSAFPTPAGMATDLDTILNKVCDTWTPEDDGHLVYLPADPTGGGGPAQLYQEIERLGWTYAPSTTGFIAAWRPDRHVILAVHPWIDPADPLVGGAWHPTAPVLVASQLHEWYAGTGTHYRHNPGAAAIANIHKTGPHSVRWLIKEPAPGGGSYDWWQPPARIVDLHHGKKPAPAKDLHQWDMRAAYLAALTAVDLPGRPVRPTGTDVDRTKAVGYFRIRGHVLSMLGPNDRQGCTWVCHPTLRFLDSIGLTPEIVDSVTAPMGTRLMRPWAEKWRDQITSRTAGSNYVAALKAGYKHAVGLMDVPGGTMYRPDWRHMIIDQVRASMLRRIGRVRQLLDLHPVAINVDAVWYRTDQPDRVGEALGIGNNIGRMRYVDETS